MPLLPDDESFLLERGYKFAIFEEGGMTCVELIDYALPSAYVPQLVSLLLRLPAGFPNAAPDMFWTFPVVQNAAGGEPLAASVRESYGGRIWQRWSRHLQNDWRPGVDSMRTYLARIRRELESGR
jgi:hypothetical protein